MSTAEKIKVKGEIELTKRTKLGQKKQVLKRALWAVK